jgi:hypothetical protein
MTLTEKFVEFFFEKKKTTRIKAEIFGKNRRTFSPLTKQSQSKFDGCFLSSQPDTSDKRRDARTMMREKREN